MSVNPYRPNFTGAEGEHPASPVFLPSHQRLQPVQPDNHPDDLWLTDELLFNYQRCHRRAFLDLYGDLSQRDPPSDYLLKLRQDSIRHQLNILGDQPVTAPTYAREDWTTGAAATLDLMQQGVDRITKPVLISELENGVKLVSTPSLLIRQSGHSYFGDWVYESVDIKLGKRPKLDYQTIAAYHAYVLAEVQGAWSETSWLMLRQRGAYAVDLVELLPRMQEMLDRCIVMLVEQQEPEVFIAHNRCDLCHWASHCYGLARTHQHLSLLPGVTPNRYTQLQALRLTTLEDLAIAPVKRLEPLPGFGAQVAHRLVQQAQATLQNQALALFSTTGSEQLLTSAELPTAPIELYFDIEAAPDHNLVYLHGVLVVDRQAQTQTFHALLAETQEEEGVIWEQLLDLIWRYPTAPVFHFCPYEVQTVRRLASEYNTPDELIEPLVKRFVDLHERVTRVAILPVESYALKPIARWLGFNWRNPDANGAQSIYWYAQWQATGDRRHLDAILQYNEDDCRATHQVKDWLVEFTQPEG